MTILGYLENILALAIVIFIISFVPIVLLLGILGIAGFVKISLYVSVFICIFVCGKHIFEDYNDGRVGI